MSLSPLPDLMLAPFVDVALAEDLGRAGDITSIAVIPAEMQGSAVLAARRPGILAGISLARLSFQRLDPSVRFDSLIQDGAALTAGAVIARVSGAARSLLASERTALNFLSHLSGIATETHKLVEAVKPHKTRICCTRKTTPGLRALEKYAVRAGGGHNHRFGLDDAVLIKDNHIAIAGSLRAAVTAACDSVGHLVGVEVEVDTLAQLDDVLKLLQHHPIDAVLLDNMDLETLAEAVRRIGGRLRAEASGGVTLATVAAIAATGVDLISAGWITHSAPILDIGMDVG